MTATLRIVLAIALALILLIVAILIWRSVGQNTSQPNPGGTQTYTNSTYDYSVSYPSGDTVKELLPEFTSIGHRDDTGTFVPDVDIAVLHAGLQEPLPSYDDFERLSAELACGLNPKKVGGVCSTVASKDPFTSTTGISGQAYTFSGDNRGAQGPFYAFNISANASKGAYAVLLIYPHQGSDVDPAVVEAVANSVQIQKKATR